MNTATPTRTLADVLTERLKAIQAGDGISPWTEAEEKLSELAMDLTRPYQLAEGEMRGSEQEWLDRAMFGAVVHAMQAAEATLIQHLAKNLADPPASLRDHWASVQLRADIPLQEG